jgi:hypothetical protein
MQSMETEGTERRDKAYVEEFLVRRRRRFLGVEE